ncbi:MAG: UDP-N-acetylmuramoyl-L-alanyl-D-glutamate--2,6-diaminopimelate ligase [Arenicellales bacterium]
MTVAVPLRDLLAGMTDPSAAGSTAVAGVALDSRRVVEGDLFLACPGTVLDGRSFINQALARGAAAIAYEAQGFEGVAPGVPAVPVAGLAARVSEIGARFYGRPSAALHVIGVTGTNGKTSCVHFLAQCLEHLGARVRMIGTLGSGEVGHPDAGGGLTTPGPLDLQRLLREYADQGVTHVVMEVSSHALRQGRVSAVQFGAAVFTNLTRDHLDYHGDIDDYAQAKKSLFRYDSLRFIAANADDSVGRQILADAAVPAVSFGDQGDVSASELQVGETGLSMRIAGLGRPLQISVDLVGRVNASNVLAVAAVLGRMDYEPAAVEAALNRLSPVPGRMELFRSRGAGPTAVVDYAHTPDALARALQSVREHCRGELWCVFGCGGDRDRGKRPEMGRIAEKWADRVVLSNDNPRSEQPARIVADILGGMSGEPQIILDRRRAIAEVLVAARRDDWVLIAGKGHETTQTIGERVIPFDDREVVSTCLGKAA